MPVSEYVLLFNSIIIGVAVTDVLISFHRLLRARSNVRWFWIPPVLGIFMLALAVNGWWGSYALFVHLRTISMAAYLPVLSLFVLTFLLMAAVLPDEVPSEGLDLKPWYVANARYIWTLWAITQAVLNAWLATLQIHSGQTALVFLREHWMNVGMFVGSLPLVFVRRLWVDSIYIALMVAVMVHGAISLVLG